MLQKIAIHDYKNNNFEIIKPFFQLNIFCTMIHGFILCIIYKLMFDQLSKGHPLILPNIISNMLFIINLE